ncbi:hypothetical protein QMK19_22405 [Streptomyces sp. H10-C2]|uniref:hypothetical protein n=1 Tax=unclassified Streptomyces TaxID=2593676 RepID=UPI0024BB6513|nr:MULTISPECIES: hypothetical protein [unclassified Streptomyces]MDJ0342489.1 hypothetical protein [Streptomyces sp. PH10-H1]MDJ0372344.1 hypothetical protein [Streptomyces sp. H10-C2]
MTRSTLPIAAVLTMATAMVLTGSGGSDSTASDEATGVPATTPATPNASGAEADTPTFKLPSDVKVKIEGFESSDATKKVALRDTSYAITAILEAEASAADKETPNFKRYFHRSPRRGVRRHDHQVRQRWKGHHRLIPLLQSVGGHRQRHLRKGDVLRRPARGVRQGLEDRKGPEERAVPSGLLALVADALQGQFRRLADFQFRREGRRDGMPSRLIRRLGRGAQRQCSRSAP